MASLKLPLFLYVLVLVILSISNPINCDDEEALLQGINDFRTALKMTILEENDKADCLADKISDELEDQTCSSTNGSNIVRGTDPEFSNYSKLLSKCHIDVNTTKDGIVLSACVPKLLFSEFHHSQYSKYFNDPKYTGIGIGSQDYWFVIVLSTNTTEGSISHAASLVPKVGLSHFLLLLLLGLFLGIVN